MELLVAKSIPTRYDDVMASMAGIIHRFCRRNVGRQTCKFHDEFLSFNTYCQKRLPSVRTILLAFGFFCLLMIFVFKLNFLSNLKFFQK